MLTSDIDLSLVLCFQKNSISDCGVTHEYIMQQLPIKLTMMELKETVTFLSNEGHIYSTIDDEHFKSTDS
uniref:Replication protein A C-terminal domain-containing protein n=1 Tax=Timema genevievae TaxID=629358 RepID=A0A7R9JW32_TIMGE|nr:unnamed protein product [Timema genevievae]